MVETKGVSQGRSHGGEIGCGPSDFRVSARERSVVAPTLVRKRFDPVCQLAANCRRALEPAITHSVLAPHVHSKKAE